MPALLLAALAAAAVAVAWAEPPAGYHPVFVAGPLLAQNLEIKNSIPGSFCNTHGKFKWLWGNPKFSKSDALCLLEGLELGGFDVEEGCSQPKDHIEVRVRGGLNGTGFQAFGIFFGSPLVDGEDGQPRLLPMLRGIGYVEDESVFEVRYDWRLSVNDWQLDVFPLTKDRIQAAVQRAGGQGAVLTGLSMAGPFLHAFISWVRLQDPAWLRKNVHAFVPVAGPWNGAVQALNAVLGSSLQTFSVEGSCPRCNPARQPKIMPDPTGIWNQFMALLAGLTKEVLDEVVGQAVRSMPSMYFMSTGVDYSREPPLDRLVATLRNGEEHAACLSGLSAACGADKVRSGTHFDDKNFLNQTQCAECYRNPATWNCSEGYELASRGHLYSLCCARHTCQERNYKASELPDLFQQLGRSTEAGMMRYALKVGTTVDPGVPVHCIYSHNVQTYTYILANTSRNLGREDVVLDDGDQTVDALSGEICTRWPSTVKSYPIPGVRHSGMLDIRQVNEVILAVATNAHATWSSWREPKMSELVHSSNSTIVPAEELLVAGAGSGGYEKLFV